MEREKRWHLLGGHIQPHIGGHIGVDVSRAAKRFAIVGAVGLVGGYLYVSNSDNSSSGSEVQTAASTGDNRSSVPEVFQAGRNVLIVGSSQNLRYGNPPGYISFVRNFADGTPLESWSIGPNTPSIVNDVPFRDPFDSNRVCILEGAGEVLNNPVVICDFTNNKGPKKNDRFPHHGGITHK